MGARRSHSLVLLLACLMATACNKPQERYQYVVLDRDGVADAVFTFDIDSAVSYSTYFCCRYDLGVVDRDNLRLFIKVVSPSGFTYRDTVAFPLYKSEAQAMEDPYTNFKIEQNWNADIEWPWRTGISSHETGVWTVSARPERYTGLYSLGFSYKPENIR